MRYIIEFTDASDSRKKSSFCDRVESDSPLPVPAIDDAVNATSYGAEKILRVQRRLISYSDDLAFVQCFCVEIEESEI